DQRSELLGVLEPPVGQHGERAVRPQRMPVGRFTLPASTPFATSSMPMPRVARALGSSWMRTAYFAAPYTLTCATPSTIDRRCAMNVSAYSSSSDSDSVPELKA